MRYRGLWKYALVGGLALASLLMVWGAVYIVWSSGPARAADALALGEVCLTSIALPATLLALLYAAEEFGRAQEQPELDLFWATDSGEMAKHRAIELAMGDWQTLRLALLNRGPVVCVWYMLEFEIPAELEASSWAGLSFAPIVGAKDNWAFSQRHGAYLYTFMSGGEVAAYPDYPLLLADVPIALHVDRQCPAECRVRYKVATDRGTPKQGQLTLRVAQR